MKRIGVVLGRGGHTAETLALVDLVGRKYEYVYMIDLLDSLTPRKIRINGRSLRVFAPRLLPQDSRIMSAIRTVITLFLSFVYLSYYRPIAVVSCGTGMAVPIFLSARSLGMKTIFVESIARINTLSQTGRLLIGRTSLFFVQWPQLASKIPGAVYGGQLL